MSGELLGLGEGLLVVIAKLKAVESLAGVRPQGEIAGLVTPLGLAPGVSGWAPDELLDLFLFRLAEETDLVWALATLLGVKPGACEEDVCLMLPPP